MQIYQDEAKAIKAAMGDNLVEIYHVGSTAVPGLAAKPRIDLIAEVREQVTHHGWDFRVGLSHRYTPPWNSR